MQRFIDNSLESNWLWLTARICLALMFVASGLAKLFDYQASLEEMRAAGLEPAWLFNIATAVTLLAGSALVLLDRKLWLGAGALAVFLLLTILIVHTFWSKTGVEAKLAMFFALEHRRVVPRVFDGVGELEAGRQVQVAAEAAGRITRIAFESGQQVQQGQLLVQLNDAVEQAELIRLKAQLRNAEILHARARKLVERNVASQEQLDNAVAARDMALGAVRQTQALIDQKAIRAPFSGQLGIRRVHLGQYLGVAEPVASLVDARTLKSNFSLDESTSPELKLGQPLEVLVDAYPGRSFPARISAIDPLIGKSRTVQVQALLDNPEGLLAAGMFASIRVSRKADAPSLSVPETAVTYTAYGDTVFVAHQEGDRPLSAKRVSVRIGERWDGRVEILQGLAEGDRVVTSGQINLSDGMAVEPVKEDTLSSAAPPVPVAGR